VIQVTQIPALRSPGHRRMAVMSKCTAPAALRLGRATGNSHFTSAAARMKHPDENPRYWRQWLQDRGVTAAVTRHIGEAYRALRGAHQRMWTFAFVGAIGGATVGTLVAALFFRQASGQGPGSPNVALMALGAAVGASLVWWGVHWLTHRSRLRSVLSLLTGRVLQGDDRYAEGVIDALAEALAASQYRPQDETSEISQVTRATIVTGLREAPIGELERSLLERLAGGAFVPTLDGSVFVFKLGPACTRCKARTRTGSLRLLQVPGHWAAANGYQRLKDLPARGQHLRVVPQRTQELMQFIGSPDASETRPTFFGPKADVLLCETCGKEAIRLGVLQNRDR